MALNRCITTLCYICQLPETQREQRRYLTGNNPLNTQRQTDVILILISVQNIFVCHDSSLIWSSV